MQAVWRGCDAWRNPAHLRSGEARPSHADDAWNLTRDAIARRWVRGDRAAAEAAAAELVNSRRASPARRSSSSTWSSNRASVHQGPHLGTLPIASG